MKKKIKNKRKKAGIPNEWHRAEKWSGGRIQRNKKKYTRKDKHKEEYS